MSSTDNPFDNFFQISAKSIVFTSFCEDLPARTTTTLTSS